ncbi:hypothetical protein K431DRAFT_330659 [Polychaeton citri CBS 116435]|uniref:Uncharacterized protein n=1 Tax=Polychaeton citri CBS 116435 TaxID=1314669 RepID=A0A9P4UPF1_9PEZI|nr:hypothetical protein K431DRAFT_330659 [Polychaeton citri CBS 116435]
MSSQAFSPSSPAPMQGESSAAAESVVGHNATAEGMKSGSKRKQKSKGQKVDLASLGVTGDPVNDFKQNANNELARKIKAVQRSDQSASQDQYPTLPHRAMDDDEMKVDTSNPVVPLSEMEVDNSTATSSHLQVSGDVDMGADEFEAPTVPPVQSTTDKTEGAEDGDDDDSPKFDGPGEFAKSLLDEILLIEDEAVVSDNISKHANTEPRLLKPDEISQDTKYEESEKDMYPSKTIFGHDLDIVHRRYSANDRFVKHGNLSIKPSYKRKAVVFVSPAASDMGYISGAIEGPSLITVKFDTSSQYAHIILEIKVSDAGTERTIFCYIFGSSISYVDIEEEVDDQKQEQQAQKTVADKSLATPIQYERAVVLEVNDNETTDKSADKPAVPKPKNDQGDGKSTDDSQQNQKKTEQKHYLNLLMLAGKRDAKRIISEIPEGNLTKPLLTKVKKGALMEIRLKPWTFEESLEYPRWSRFCFSGVSKHELDDWEREANNGGSSLNASKKFIGALHNCKQLQIYLDYEDKEAAFLEPLNRYMLGALSASANWGLFWQYELQLGKQGKSIYSSKVDLSKLAVPRHLVSLWEVMVDKTNEKQVSKKPSKWASFITPDVWPLVGPPAFLHRLGEARETQKCHDLMVVAISRCTGITATFTSIEEEGETCWAEINIPPLHLKDVDGKELSVPYILPTEGDLFKLKVGTLTLLGQVSDPKVDTKATICADIRGKSCGDLEDSKVYDVQMQIAMGTQSADRRTTAMHRLSKGHTRSTGPDLTALMFDIAPVTFWPGKIASDLSAGLPRILEQIYLKREDGSRVHPLNDEQEAAVLDCFTTSHGALALIGAPGTGKSEVIFLVVKLFLMLKYTVAVLAPANSQVDNALAVFKSRVDTSSPQFKAARCRNVHFNHHSHTQLLQMVDRFEAQQNQEDAMEGVSEAVDPALIDGESGFSIIKNRMILEMAQRTTAVGKIAKQYIACLRKMQKKGVKNTPKALNEKKRELEAELMTDIVRQVKCWFVTTNSTGHGFIRQYVKPEVLIVEEAALASGADLSVAFDTFKESAKLVLLVGDHKQQAPICLSSDRNESSLLMKKSQFERIVDANESTMSNCKVIWLKKQYRCPAAVFETWNNCFYDGKLVHGIENPVRQEVTNTVTEFMSKKYGKDVWNTRCRVGVSVDGPNVESVHPPNGTSLINLAEAGLIVKFLTILLSYEPDLLAEDKPGYQIRPEDIGITTPYDGQNRYIRRMLRSEPDPRLHNIFVDTASKAQGMQFPIHIISFTRRNPKNDLETGFIVDKGQLCVQLSRAQCFQFVFGNFGGWVNTIKNHRKTITTSKEHFYRVVNDFNRASDIIAATDFEAGLDGEVPRKKGFSVPSVPRRDTGGRDDDDDDDDDNNNNGGGGKSSGNNKGKGKGQGQGKSKGKGKGKGKGQGKIQGNQKGSGYGDKKPNDYDKKPDDHDKKGPGGSGYRFNIGNFSIAK